MPRYKSPTDDNLSLTYLLQFHTTACDIAEDNAEVTDLVRFTIIIAVFVPVVRMKHLM
jgi:hypothetical protein